MPFDLVQRELLSDELNEVIALQNRIDEIGAIYTEIIDAMEDDEKEGKYLNDTNDAFVSKELKAAVDEILQDVTSEEIGALIKYQELSKKKDKLAYIRDCKLVDWSQIETGADSTCKKSAVNARITELKMSFEFPENSVESRLVQAFKLSEEETALKKEIKQKSEALHLKTKAVIEAMDEDTALKITEYKWIRPLVESLTTMPEVILAKVIEDITYLSQKYATTLTDIQSKKVAVSKGLVEMLSNMEGGQSDMEGLLEFKRILGGRNAEEE